MNEPYQDPLYADADTVKFFKEMYTEFTGTDEYNEVDILLRPHLHMLNIHDDLATRYCCQGHFDDGETYPRFYILFSATRHGQHILETITSRFIHELGFAKASSHQVSMTTFMDYRYKKPHWCIEFRTTVNSQLKTIELFMSVWNKLIVDFLPHFHPLRKGT